VNVQLTDCGRSESGFAERADCTVRATAAALGIKYDEAHAKLAALGRKDRARFKWLKHAASLGFETRPDLSCQTVEKALKEMQRGRFIVRVSCHVFAVVNGTVLDMFPPKPKAQVKMVYQSEVL
jgi:hypothetical protein